MGIGYEREQLIKRMRNWGERKTNVRAIVQTGSLVRGDGLADDYSDIDIEIIANEPATLIGAVDWVNELGKPITMLHLDAEEEDDWPTCLVIFGGRVKVDFTLAGPARLKSMIEQKELLPLYERGYKFILDKDKFSQYLPSAGFSFPIADGPTEACFRERVEEFWFEAFHVHGYLAREELFLVKQRDWTMKELLLEMMEWHALALNEKPVDIWHSGKGLRRWAGEDIWLRLQDTFGNFDAKDALRAYESTTALYSELARMVASIKGWAYPEKVEEQLR